MMTDKIKIFPLDSKKAPGVPKGTDWRSWDKGADTPVYGLMIPKGVYIIDLDTYKGVTTEQADAAIGVPLAWSEAELQRTMSGGTHYAFRVPDSADLTNGANVGGVSGLDTRASGKGYIATGRGYEPLAPFGVIEALAEKDLLPELPEEALAFFATGGADSDDDDLLGAVSALPLDFTDEQVAHYMSKLTAEQATDSGSWLTVMFGLYHQTQGSEAGWQLFDAFSRLAPTKYNERENRKRWESAGKNRRGKPVTFASVVEMAGGRGEVVLQEGGFFEKLCFVASNVDSVEAYGQFKQRVQQFSDREIGPDLRAMLAAELYNAFGKDAGMTKTDIKRSLAPPKKKRTVDGDAPDWLQDWVYIEKKCEFANTELAYSIRQEAFNAKFSRMGDCVVAEKPASAMALVNYGIPTYVDEMFWPGAGQVIEQDGCEYLNTYRADGVPPDLVVGDDGQKAIDRMLAHLAITLKDAREQEILLDWITYVYRNPGKRVNWSILLQGGYGTGKSYFSVLMQTLMGKLVGNIDPQAIAGRFTGWAHGYLVAVVEEIRINGTNKYEVVDRMKPFISNDTVQIEEKGRDHRTVPNFTSYFMLTNHKDAIPLKDGDRRFCVMFGALQTEAQLYAALGGETEAADYFDRLFGDLREHGGALANYFSNRPISADFRAQGRAPDTASKRVMLNVAASGEQHQIVDYIHEHDCCVINDSVLDVSWLRELVENEGGGMLPHQRTLSAVLLELGYEPVEGKKVKLTKNRKNHYVWFDPTKTTSDKAKDEVKAFHDDPNHVPF